MRVDEPREQRPFLGARLPGGPLRAPRRQVLLHRRASALERAVRRRNARLEEGRRLTGRPAEHVAHDQCRALSRWQDLHRGQECQLDRLALHHHRIRLMIARRNFVQQPVGVRLEPRQIGE